jgi:hypothetical protein
MLCTELGRDELIGERKAEAHVLSSVFTTNTGIRIVSSDIIRDIRILEIIATIQIVRISIDSIRG